MIKSKILKFATLAAGLAFGSAASAAGGDIYEIRPCTVDGTATEAYATIDSPLTSGESVYFKVRLIQRQARMPSSVWKIEHVGAGSEIVDDVLYPLQIGIYVSGQLRYATLIDSTSDADTGFTDLVFEYKTRAGDFALPIVLATAEGPASYSDSSLSYLLNPLRTAKWRITNDDGNTCNFWFWTQNWYVTPPDGTRAQDYSLSKCGFYVQTIDFDSTWEEAGTLWRSVHQNSTITVGGAPSLEAKAAPEDAVTLYVWSTDENAVKVRTSDPPVNLVTGFDGEGNPLTTPTQVGTVTLAGGQLKADFQIEGVTEGESCKLVLSPWKNYTYPDGTGDRITDFITVPVKCIEPMPPTAIVETDRTIAYANGNFMTYGAVLSVYLSQPYEDGDVAIRIDPSFADLSTADWGDYVRFSATQDEVTALPEAVAPTVTIEAGSTAKKQIFVFCLRGDTHTTGSSRMVFTPVVTDAAAAAVIQDATAAGMEIRSEAPVVTTPSEGAKIAGICGDDMEFTVAVSDTFADISDATTGYKIFIKYRASDAFKQLEGAYYVGEGNVLMMLQDDGAGGYNKTTKLPVINYPASGEGLESQVYVVSPVSGKKSEVRNFTADIKEARTTAVETTDGKDDVYNEGDRMNVKITLSEKNDTGATIYAFLRPSDNAKQSMFAGTKMFVVCDDLPASEYATKTKGLAINKNLDTATGTVQLLDGENPDDGGLNVQFEVVLCTTQYYSESARIAGYDSNFLNVIVYNVEPLIKRIEMNGFQSESDGYTFSSKVPKGMEQVFGAVVTDKGSFDLDNGFQTKWTATLSGVGAIDTKTIDGNPNEGANFYKYSFPRAGSWTIKCQVKDKDMADWSDVTYSVNVEVLDNPQVEVIAPEVVAENDGSQKVQVQLSYWDPLFTGRLRVKLTVSEYSAGKPNPGVLKLDSQFADAEENVYYVEVGDALPVDVMLETLDGTQVSSVYGFVVKAEVVSTDELPTSKTAANDYYVSDQARILVNNVEPVCAVSPNENTNRWEVAGGAATSRKIIWSVRSDVDADFAGIPTFPGIKVSFTGCDNETEFYVTEATSGTFIPNFGSRQGDQDLVLTIEDKDGGIQTWTWQFTITPSKFLHTLANGPSGGTTTSQLSQKYALADGIGMGHTFVEGALFSAAKNFRLSWNCSKQIYMNIYGFGYKVANPDDDGTLDGMDIAIDGTGARENLAAVIADPYHYPLADREGEEKKDSFFYCWLLHAQSEQGGMTSSILGNTIAPERPGVIGQGTVTLPTEQTQDGSYIDTFVEAVFAKEWLPADNLGDINQDGVPDAFAIKTWKGGKLIPLVAGVENDTDADLVDLAQSNPDEDYLPGVFGDVANSYAPIGQPFGTRIELRGFDNGLNATDYTASDVSFSDAEQAAYTAATGKAYDPATVDLAEWSPEPNGPQFARMDPTMEDTDGDRFPDGWEYYFWYQAHVWAPAGNANGRPRPNTLQHFVFERFTRDDILHGEEIPAAEVEARFNPCVQLLPKEYADNPDFDNDGLSDLEELALGTNPCHWDTDGDQMCDGWEVMMLLDPLGMSRIGNGDGDYFACHDMSGDLILTAGPDGDDTSPFDPEAEFYTIIDPLENYVDYMNVGVDTAIVLRDLKVKVFRCVPKFAQGARVTYGDLILPADLHTGNCWGSCMVDDVELQDEPLEIPAGTLLHYGAGYDQQGAFQSYVLVHDQVMKAFGFDPRTGWSAASGAEAYVSDRWNPALNTSLSLADVAGAAVNTTAYHNYDEYLLLKYRMDYGLLYTLPDEEAPANLGTWTVLSTQTTNPSAANPHVVADATEAADDAAGDDTADGDADGKTNEAKYAELIVAALQEQNSNLKPVTTHGADTDGDGVPDGWELYTGRSPNFVFNNLEMETGGLPGDYDGDMLTYEMEYAGTDACEVYKTCESIYANHPGNAKGWFNKFFPTHPGTWIGAGGNPDGADTDGDGIGDGQEGLTWMVPFFYEGQTITECEMGFIYGAPADEVSCCIRGAGMNPCTVDTDQDGIPDGWEMQHAGVPVDLATRQPVPPLGGRITVDLELSASTIIADGLAGAATEGVYIMGGMDATWNGDAVTLADAKDPLLGTVRDTDFDHDGLQNFQEYAVQSLRHLRYDDHVTPLMGRLFTEGAPHAQKFLGYLAIGTVFDAASPENTIENALAAWAGAEGAPSEDELAARWNEDAWRTLGYFVPPVHGWDRSLTAAIIADPVYEFPAIGSIVTIYGGAGYVSSDPRMADTDQDGMDDYYELFHGLNPILGTMLSAPANSPLLLAGKSGDIISTTYNALVYPFGDSRPTFNAWNNEWMMPDYDIEDGRGGGIGSLARPTGLAGGAEGLDPILYPWTMGTPLADPDGDGIRNDEERILANATDPLPQHTDPTPRWFTERTTAASYTAQYYVTPTRVQAMPFVTGLGIDDYAAAAYLGNSSFRYLYAFEENEGYDTDNDFAPDGHEIVKGVSRVTDPLRQDDPHRRQALYLDGVNSYAMSRDPHVRPVDAPDLFKQFTVECWVRPEKMGAAQTILERSTAYEADANNKDRVAIRANFRLGLTADGRAYGLFDNNDAIESGLNAPTSCQRLESEAALPLNAWSHVALSYDGAVLKLFVNGKRVAYAPTTLIPANGVVQTSQDISWLNTNGLTFAYRSTPVAFFVGARPKREAVEALTPSYIDPVTGEHLETFANVREFFKGYVDEVRAWDGARSEEEIAASYATRMDYKAISDNRNEVFRVWYQNGTRNNNDGNPTLPPELVLHYDFSTLPGALNATDVAQAPVGFTKMTLGQATFDHTGDEINAAGLYPNIAEIKEAATGDGQLAIGWWDQCLQKSTVYKDYTVVPWIANSVARLPALDGASVDSEYYGENMSAGYVPAAAGDVSKFVFPNAGLPYQGYVYNFDRALHLDRLARYVAVTGSGAVLMKRAEFQVRNNFLGTSELVPLGGAYAKACDKMWDGAAGDLWEYTGTDADADGLPDWWETYAQAQGYYAGGDLSWDTEVTYNGRKMTAAQAYQIDLYKGVMPVNGVAKLNASFQSTVSTTGDLIPDWWKTFYDILDYDAYDDPDGDGLCNYVEYLLSVAFDVGAKFDPLDAYSVSPTEIDYFYPIGELYAGEIFTDHDMMSDTLEDSWGEKFASRFAWDRLKDEDEDGWSNFAEASYHDFTARITANYASHVVGDAEIKDLPIPTLNLTLRYNGSQPLTGSGDQQGGGSNDSGNEDSNTLAPLVVQTFTRPGYVVPDATFNVQPGEARDYYFPIGAWGDRVVRGTLTPGYVNPGSFELEFAEVDRNDSYTYIIEDLTPVGAEYAAAYPAGAYVGSYENYMGLLGMFGPDYIKLQSTEFAWQTFQEAAAITVTQDESGEDGYICCYGERIGNINLMTGAFSLDMGPLRRHGVISTNDTNASYSLAQSVLRIKYNAVVPKLQSNKLNLFLGEPQTGYVKEGKNTIIAFYDLDGNGKYTAGEPMGCAMDVDVGWHQGVADIELTDTSPIITRADLQTGTSDRKALYGTDDGDYYDLVEGQLSGGKYQRLRVVRTLVNGVGINQLGVYNRVLVDRWVEMDQRGYFNEVDVLQNGELDLDWSYLYDEVVNNSAVKSAGIDPTEVTYRIVLGNGTIDTAATNNLFGIATTRHFDLATLRTRPIALSPGNADAVVRDARPTFKWSMGGFNSYTAFQLQILSGSTVVWDSGVRRAPSADLNNVYTFTADAYAGDVLANDTSYTWRVSMFNAKFKSTFWSAENPVFRMSVPTAGYGYGTIPVCVRYYGPKVCVDESNVRVEAYTTPDFTGEPVARGRVMARTSVYKADAEHAANCTLIGLPKGTYYVRAWLDLNKSAYGTRYVREDYEAWGYACGREKAPAQPYAALPITIDDVNAGMKPVDVYIEDVDTNGNVQPDTWEIVRNGGRLNNGATGVNATLAGTFASATALANLPSKAGTTADAIRAYIDQSFASPEVAALVMGLAPQQVTITATGSVVVESKVESVEISGVALDAAGNLTLKVDGKLAAAADGKGIYQVVTEPTKTVTCRVYAKQTLEQADWTLVAEQTVAVGGGAATIAVPGAANAASGFYKAVVTE